MSTPVKNRVVLRRVDEGQEVLCAVQVEGGGDPRGDGFRVCARFYRRPAAKTFLESCYFEELAFGESLMALHQHTMILIDTGFRIADEAVLAPFAVPPCYETPAERPVQHAAALATAQAAA